ncbi:MAG: hypothetical protein ACO3C5_09220 [Ilumatobacteraceae bacterium]
MSDVPTFPAPDPKTRWEPPEASPPVTPTPRRRRRWFAVGLFLVTLSAAAALFSEGTRRAGEAAGAMVRVSAGCRVPVTLNETGDFFVYIEEGPVPMPDSADCTNAGMAMSNPHGIPMVGFAVATPDGVERRVDEVRPNRRYDFGRNDGILTSRFAGRSGETVIVGLVADSPDVAIAIGENVFSTRTPWRIAAGVVLAIGLLLFGGLVRAAARR